MLFKHEIDILSLNKTWLKPSFNSLELLIHGYSFHRVDRVDYKGGGVAILVDNKF